MAAGFLTLRELDQGAKEFLKNISMVTDAKIIDDYDDDHELCIDVEFTGVVWPEHKRQKFHLSILWCGIGLAAAFEYAQESPRAQQVIVSGLKERLAAIEQED